MVAAVVRSGSGTMTEDERRQQRREAGLKRAQTMGKERLRQAVLKGHAKRSPEERSEAARKAAATRNRNRAAKKNEGQTPGS
jgi:hypothetical protein